jgi:hypothetical protein
MCFDEIGLCVQTVRCILGLLFSNFGRAIELILKSFTHVLVSSSLLLRFYNVSELVILVKWKEGIWYLSQDILLARVQERHYRFLRNFAMKFIYIELSFGQRRMSPLQMTNSKIKGADTTSTLLKQYRIWRVGRSSLPKCGFLRGSLRFTLMWSLKEKKTFHFDLL